MTDIVNGLLLRNDRVLMARRSAKRRLYPNTWSFPGGHVEAGETFEQALIRELVEELGVLVKDARLLTRLEVPSDGAQSCRFFHLYGIEDWGGEPTNLGNEHSEILWVPLVEAFLLPNLALQSYKQVFNSLINR